MKPSIKNSISKATVIVNMFITCVNINLSKYVFYILTVGM